MYTDEFTRQPQNVLVNAGQMALIECEYGSRAVRWRKGSTSILDMEDASNPCDCQILSDGDLQFNNASLGDAGDYTCFVLVSHGVTNTCTATLGLAGESTCVYRDMCGVCSEYAIPILYNILHNVVIYTSGWCLFPVLPQLHTSIIHCLGH